MNQTGNRPNPEEDASRLRHIADTLPAYIAYVDAELRYVMVNRTYQEWFGRTESEMVGRPVAEVLGSSYENVRAHLEGALAGTTQEFETLMRTIEGDRFLGVIHVPDRDEDGRILGVIVHGYDITARRLAEEELRVSEERLRLALDAASDVGTWDWDVTHDRVRADAAFARLYELDPAVAASGAPLASFTHRVHPDDAPKLRELTLAALRSGGEYAAEYRLLLDDGSTRWIAAKGRCTTSPDGVARRFPGVSIDITDRKTRESALLQSEKLAAVGRLASSIAHEINNPLEAVVNLLYLIEGSATDEETRSYAHTAQRELARASQIATQTLRFYRQSTSPTRADPGELINSVLALHQGRLVNSGIDVNSRVRGHVHGCYYEGEMRQVLNNLIGNAIDSMRSGGHLTLCSRPAADVRSGKRGVRITVSDTGHGIDVATMRRIFDPFFTTKGATGSGLGLWVSSEIVKKHGGRLTVRSSQRPKRSGTVFRLFMPFA